eukprot:Ihof_evm18s62 gene=Ihof_evmTU18s62
MELLSSSFYESIGMLQAYAVPKQLPGYELNLPFPEPPPPPVSGLPPVEHYAKQIVNVARDTIILVDSLPSIESTADQQLQDLEALGLANEAAAKMLQDSINRG